MQIVRFCLLTQLPCHLAVHINQTRFSYKAYSNISNGVYFFLSFFNMQIMQRRCFEIVYMRRQCFIALLYTDSLICI